MSPDQTFRALLAVGFFAFLPVGLYQRLKSQATGEKLDRRQEGPFIFLTLRPVAAVTMFGFIAHVVHPAWMAWASVSLPLWARWAGAVAGLFGTGLFIWTFPTLGKNLTDTVVTRQAHTLVTSGPYRWVRHPFYDAGALFLLGNALAAANWFLFLSGGLVVVLLIVRTSTEEEKLVARFGDSYRAYSKRTGRFLPRIGAKSRGA